MVIGLVCSERTACKVWEALLSCRNLPWERPVRSLHGRVHLPLAAVRDPGPHLATRRVLAVQVSSALHKLPIDEVLNHHQLCGHLRSVHW